MILVDTNYFIRFIENDNEKQVKIVQDLFLDGIQGIKKFTINRRKIWRGYSRMFWI